ncbi:hypothetical protein [Hydrocarboniclastica marina]|uniref:Uncharacterized protein n=1 Tax=Hydrocarboniclastica marina TaxID=2259620 RepID=A0A4P7XKN2_9ALTE|nr:hypothetical protein [Hydrocarboniclastica marina]QCF27618.1 hypothetical protein soil367_17745 [Hydrocarboniclastica marina]
MLNNRASLNAILAFFVLMTAPAFADTLPFDLPSLGAIVDKQLAQGQHVDQKDGLPHESEPGFSYLPPNTARYFKKILKGDKRAGGSASSRIGLFLAFHRAYASTCQAEMGANWSEYTFTRESERLALREAETIRLAPEAFNDFYLAAVSLVPLIILEYEQDPIKDFGSRDPNEPVPQIYEIHVQHNARSQAEVVKLLNHEGCGSEIVENMRAAVSENLPETQVEEGESTVTMLTEGAGSFTFTLDSPYDPGGMRSQGLISSSDSGLFPLGGDYGGRMLSYLALGDFGSARGEQAKSLDEVSRQIRSMAPPGYNPVAEFYEWGFRTQNSLSPFNALITSYIIRRVQLLGSCGDSLVPLARTYVEIETTRNGYGVELRSREVGRYTDRAVVPAAFAPIVERGADLTPGRYSRALVDGALEKLSCDSEMRQHLEANMLAFNSGDEPAWISPEARKTFGAVAQDGGAGESAYVYTDAQAAIALIEKAANNQDPRLSLQYKLADAENKQEEELNLVRIDGIPALAFDTRYMSSKAGDTLNGRTAGLLMTCAGNGKLEISQLLWNSNANELDQSARYKLTYSAYGIDAKWPVSVQLESAEIEARSKSTYARFRGQMNVDENTFAGLRLTSSFSSFIPIGQGRGHLSWGVSGSRVNKTLAPLIEQCRSIGS